MAGTKPNSSGVGNVSTENFMIFYFPENLYIYNLVSLF